jgi:hypothetical protein
MPQLGLAMTSWKRNAIVALTIACQLLAGALSGRAVYLSHCGDHQREACQGPEEDCGSGAGCLAGGDHHHVADLGHDHRCRCPHFHLQSEIQRAERSRLHESLRGLVLAPVPKSWHASQDASGLVDRAAFAPILAADPGPPQTVLALRSIRLLV